MEHLLKAAFLGLIQGLTEFLPISSSGHLVLFGQWLHFEQQGIAFEVFVHFGTLLSVLLAFRKEIKELIVAPFLMLGQGKNDPKTQQYFRWDVYIIIATIPAGVVGLLFKDRIEQAFTSVVLVLAMLFITGLLMFSTQFLPLKKQPFTLLKTFLMGVAQAFAILPGISRSGSTIFTGIALGMDREEVARFSFIMSLPAIFGAVLLQTLDLLEMPPTGGQLGALIVGALVAFVSGYFAILWLLDVVKRGKLQWFGYYCLALSVLGLLLYL